MEVLNNLFKCSKCLLFKEKDQFHVQKNSKYGIRNVCKDCRKIERRQRYEQNKEQELEYGIIYKLNNPEKRRKQSNDSAAKHYLKIRTLLNELKNVPCADCGNKYPPCVMDFEHHTPENKLFNVSDGMCKNINILMAEIDKCDIVCACCHRIREHNRKHKKISAICNILIPFKEHPCMDCGIQYHWRAMDFDHVDTSSKLFDISKPRKIVGFSLKESIIAEINKCELVCANCHRIRTFHE